MELLPSNGSLNHRFRGLEINGTLGVDTGFELVVLTTTIPLWTFATLYLLLLLIHYLRRIQNFKLYDRCTPKNAHFTYDFHIVIGKTSANYSTRESHLIVDLLDNQLISAMTIQVPGTTIFNDNQIFMYNHSRNNLRCVNFTIYRRHPIKDIRCLRIAHSCSNPDSRLYIYGLNLYDSTNAENKFFPISSIIKNRGTQWALNTTFEPRSDVSFSKLGCDCYDPFGTSIWPTYMELLVIIFYLWSSVLCFGHLISVKAIGNNIALHCLTITFISGTSAAVIAFAYLRLVKYYTIDQHSESTTWLLVKNFIISVVVVLCLAFWSGSTKQLSRPRQESLDWAISSAISSSLLTIILLITNYVLKRRKLGLDNVTLSERDAILAKTNSKPNMEFFDENSANFFSKAPNNNQSQQQQQPQQQQQQQQHQQQQVLIPGKKSTSNRSLNKDNLGATKGNTGSGRKGSSHNKRRSTGNSKQKEGKHPEETLDNAFNSDGVYIKTKNRNSISQYI